MSEFMRYAQSLSAQTLTLMYGELGAHVGALYVALARLADPARGDLLLINRRDAKLLKDGEVVYRLSDETHLEDQWRRDDSDSPVNDAYIRRNILDVYLKWFAMIIARDEMVRRYVRLLDDQDRQLIIKIYTTPK